jgi:hypothetical protein
MYFPWSLDDDTIAFENTFDNLDSLKKYKVSLEETLERIDVPGAGTQSTGASSPNIETLGGVVQGHLEGKEGKWNFSFLISEVALVTVTQSTVARQFDWHPATFGESFYDLARAGSQFRSLDLEEVKQLLSEDASKSSEVFEAYGIKFPAGGVDAGGFTRHSFHSNLFPDILEALLY